MPRLVCARSGNLGVERRGTRGTEEDIVERGRVRLRRRLDCLSRLLMQTVVLQLKVSTLIHILDPLC